MNHSSSFYIQQYICTVTIIFMELWGSLIVFRSMKRGSWWLARNQRTSSNSSLYLIPHSTFCFIFFEGVFFIVWIAYMYYNRAIDLGQISGRLRWERQPRRPGPLRP